MDNAGDVVTELASAGTDTVLTTQTSYTLAGNVEVLSFAGAGDFAGAGNTLANTLSGGSGNDTLNGGIGADTMTGGLGDDLLTGGANSDLFVFHQGEGNGDTVVDFTHAVDSLEFDGYGSDGHGLGATFTEIGATNQWVIHDGVHLDETITFTTNPVIGATDYHFH